MARTTYNMGPGVVVVGATGATATTFYSKDDIVVTESLTTSGVESSVHGTVNESVDERVVEVSFTPLPLVLSDLVAALFPYQSFKLGQEIFPQTDVPLVIVPLDGEQRSYAASAVTKLPSLNLGYGKDLFGSVTYTCLGAGDTAWSTANSLVTPATIADWNAVTRDLDVSKLVRSPFKGNWPATGATAPWLDFYTKEGFVITPSISLTAKSNDAFGIQNYSISDFGVTCSFVPTGITETALAAKFKLQGSGAQRGQLISGMGSGADLKIEGGATPTLLSALIKGASIKEVKRLYSKSNPRHEISMVATKTSLGGTLADLFTIAVS